MTVPIASRRIVDITRYGRAGARGDGYEPAMPFTLWASHDCHDHEREVRDIPMTNVVIQCAGRKSSDAGYFQTKDGQRVVFVAYPEEAPRQVGTVYAHPDQVSEDGKHTWRERLLTYNAEPRKNAHGLLPAWRLYQPSEYRALVDVFGSAHTFILSAGWGLIRSDLLTPYYDITLSRPSKCDQHYKWRRPGDHFEDFCHLSPDDAEPVIFMGGANYRPLFESLTSDTTTRKTIYYRSGTIEGRPGFTYERYVCRRRTNWHYSCANDLIAGRL